MLKLHRNVFLKYSRHGVHPHIFTKKINILGNDKIIIFKTWIRNFQDMWLHGFYLCLIHYIITRSDVVRNTILSPMRLVTFMGVLLSCRILICMICFNRFYKSLSLFIDHRLFTLKVGGFMGLLLGASILAAVANWSIFFCINWAHLEHI